MASRVRSNSVALMVYATVIAISAGFGTIGMITGLLPVEPSLAERLPWHSPVFGGIALALVVGLPSTALAVLAGRRHPRRYDAASVVGLLLVGWIVVEGVVVRQFSPLQVIYAGAGAGLIALFGSLESVRQCIEVVAAVPAFVTAPLLRHWHLRWGATPAEVSGPLPGDSIVPVSHFTATRAITIDAAPEDVWPCMVQVGFGRAGFYSYDLLDNLGRPSASEVLDRWQRLEVGDLIAPMANPPTSATSFVVAELAWPTTLVWAKPDSTWSWSLRSLPGGGTRLVTRIKQRYRWSPAGLLTVVLAEVGDFPMMRRMLRGIKARAERTQHGSRASRGDASESRIDLFWLPLGAGGRLVRANGRIYEALAARREHRRPASLFHAALEVRHAGARYVIEMAPVWAERSSERGVVREGPVGARWLGRSRAFRYEVRCWLDGRIPDVAYAVDSPRHLSADPDAAAELLSLVLEVPGLTWGRDELGAGEMWNSNSLVAWLLARTGHDMSAIHPPAGGRAPGWQAGLLLAGRQQHESGHPDRLVAS